ncbi:hypothetical protein Tco_1397093 [Tanacetum coccineum]
MNNTTPDPYSAATQFGGVTQALKESKKTNIRQPGTRGSSEGTSRIPWVPGESTIISSTSREGTGTKPKVPDEEKVTSEANVILNWGLENESKHSEDSQLKSNEKEKKDNDGDADDEDEGDDHINVEMVKAETIKRENKEKDEMTDAAIPDVEKTTEEKGDAELARNAMTSNYQFKESTEFPMSSSSLYVSSGFGTQFLNLSSDVSWTGVLKDYAEAEISSLMDVYIQQETPQIQSPLVQKVPVSVISETTNLLPIPKIPTETLVSIALSPPHLRVAKSEKDMFKLKKIDHIAETLTSLKSQVLMNPRRGALEIHKLKKEHVEKQKMTKYTIKSTDKAALKEYDQKSALYQTIHENKSFNRNPANHALYHALMEALIEDENAMDKGVTNIVKNYKRQHDDDDDDDDEDLSAGPNQGKKRKRKRTKESESTKKPSTSKDTSKGKALSKSSKTGKFATTKEPVKEPIAEVVMDDAVNTAGEDVVHDDDQPQDTLEPKTDKTLKQDWFKQPPRPPTLDPEWNKRQVVHDQPEQHWFNQMESAAKDPLIFNDLMATPIDFSKYVLNQLKTYYLTQDLLVGPTYCRLGHLTVPGAYFFNNDLEFLKTSDPEKIYTTSITKTKAARYEIMGIEDMTPTLWSTIKHGYDKDAEKGDQALGRKA